MEGTHEEAVKQQAFRKDVSLPLFWSSHGFTSSL